MPLAPAHPAVVLPLHRLGLPLSALVAGAVAPDAPVYLPVGVTYETTHSAGGLPVDAVIGCALVGVWFALVRDAVVDLTPFLRSRASATARLSRRGWLLAPLAAAVGAATHVLWDSVTHDWGFVVEQVALLREDVGPAPLYRWLQHGSTVGGSVVVGASCVVQLHRLQVVPRSPLVARGGWWPAPVVLVASAVGVVLRDPEAAVGVALVGLVVVAVTWRVAAHGLHR